MNTAKTHDLNASEMVKRKEVNRMKQMEHWLLHQQRESSSVFLHSRETHHRKLFLVHSSLEDRFPEIPRRDVSSSRLHSSRGVQRPELHHQDQCSCQPFDEVCAGSSIIGYALSPSKAQSDLVKTNFSPDLHQLTTCVTIGSFN